MKRISQFPVPLLFLPGCSRAPSFDIMGSFFPAWLLCFLAAIVLTFFTHWLLDRLHVVLAFPIAAYPSLTALFAFSLWLAFFR